MGGGEYQTLTNVLSFFHKLAAMGRMKIFAAQDSKTYLMSHKRILKKGILPEANPWSKLQIV